MVQIGDLFAVVNLGACRMHGPASQPAESPDRAKTLLVHGILCLLQCPRLSAKSEWLGSYLIYLAKKISRATAQVRVSPRRLLYMPCPIWLRREVVAGDAARRAHRARAQARVFPRRLLFKPYPICRGREVVGGGPC